jgi:hypothetical protein
MNEVIFIEAKRSLTLWFYDLPNHDEPELHLAIGSAD